MEEKTHSFNYRVYTDPSELNPAEKSLTEAAVRAMEKAYAPYSKFHVGAAVLLDDGTTVIGANQENVAYPAGLCAERTAMFAAGANYPKVPFAALAIAGGPEGVLTDSPVTPCGECRQVMAEYARRYGKSFALLLVGKTAVYRFDDCLSLLPFGFAER